MENRNRNTALLLIFAGLFFIAGKIFGFLAVSAVLMILLGIYKIRADGDLKGYAVLITGAVILLGNHLFIVIALIMVSLGYYLFRAGRVHRRKNYEQRQNIAESLRWDKEPWVLGDMSRWSLLSEVRIDLSLALPDHEETTVMLQGIVGDVEILVPEEFGVELEASVLLGRIGIGREKESGLLNKRTWQSPNYHRSLYKLKLIVSYAVGDIEVKML